MRNLVKCEYRYWETAPWFYTLVFSLMYFLIAFVGGLDYLTLSTFTLVAFPMLIFIGTLIAVVNWGREYQYGGTITLLTMPVTRREYLVSKYISVFWGQLLFTFVVVLSITVSFALVVGDVYWKFTCSALLTLGMIVLGSTINYYFTLTGRRSHIFIVSGILVVIYHIVYYFTTAPWPEYCCFSQFIIILTTCVLIVSGPLVAWLVGWRYFSGVKDIA